MAIEQCGGCDYAYYRTRDGVDKFICHAEPPIWVREDGGDNTYGFFTRPEVYEQRLACRFYVCTGVDMEAT